MAQVQSFRAYRYDLGRVGALSKVIAPPYDVIDDALLKKLQDSNAHNIVHVDMPKPAPTDREPNDCYARSNRLLKDWIRDGFIKQDSARSLYVYHQEFKSEGKTHIRKGVLARVRLERFDSGIILPHEETLAGPKLDRLRLMEATEMNLSPGFGLYEDKGEAQELMDAAVSRQPPIEAADHTGVVGRIWPVSDQHLISQFTGMLGPKALLIADGHHRYETSVHYRDQVLGAKVNESGDEPVRYTLMMLVGMSDPGLIVLPTHRLVRGCGPISGDQLINALSPAFEVKKVGSGRDAASAAWDQVSIDIGQSGLAFGLTDGSWWTARPRDLSRMNELAAEHSTDWRLLSVSVLHKLVLGPLIRPAAGKAFEFEYVHLWDETADAMAAGKAELAVLVPAVDVRHDTQDRGRRRAHACEVHVLLSEVADGLPVQSAEFELRLGGGLDVGHDELLGTWQATAINVSEKGAGDLHVTLRSDGTFSWTVGRKIDFGTWTWEQQGTQLWVRINGNSLFRDAKMEVAECTEETLVFLTRDGQRGITYNRVSNRH